MNNCIFKGRIASDPEFRTTQSGVEQCRFRIAVNRRFKNAKGEREADFFQCVAWKQNANYIHKFIHKGDEFTLRGELQNRSYDAQDGTKRYITEIIVSEIEGSAAGRADGNADRNAAPEDAGFAEVDDAELPF